MLKAAAYAETSGAGRDRHCLDFAALGAMLAARDMNAFALTPKDRKRFRTMITATLESSPALLQNPLAERRLARLARIVDA